MEHFTQWFNEKLKVDRFPVPNEIQQGGKHQDINVFINVSDDLYIDYVQEIVRIGSQHYYFPMGELSEDMGLSSLYGALEVLYHSYSKDLRVLLHCQAGRNRSPTVQCAFYFMMTGEHITEEYSEGGIILKSNQLFYNAGKHLPHLEWIEEWLKNCRHAFDNSDRFLGGKYDYCVDRTNVRVNIKGEHQISMT